VAVLFARQVRTTTKEPFRTRVFTRIEHLPELVAKARAVNRRPS
jgi:hypothetical protein